MPRELTIPTQHPAFERARKRFGSEEVLQAAFRAFLEEGPELERRLVEAQLKGDLESVALGAHNFKGSLLMLDADEAVQAVEEVLHRARQGLDCEAKLRQFFGHLQELRRQLGGYLRDFPDGSRPNLRDCP